MGPLDLQRASEHALVSWIAVACAGWLGETPGVLGLLRRELGDRPCHRADQRTIEEALRHLPGQAVHFTRRAERIAEQALSKLWLAVRAIAQRLVRAALSLAKQRDQRMVDAARREAQQEVRGRLREQAQVLATMLDATLEAGRELRATSAKAPGWELCRSAQEGRAPRWSTPSLRGGMGCGR